MDDSDLQDVLSTVRDFVRNRVVPRELEIEEYDQVPQEIRDDATAMGLFGWAIPEEFGGLGLNAYQDAQLAFELGYTTPAFRSLFGTNNGIAGQATRILDDSIAHAQLAKQSGQTIGQFHLAQAMSAESYAELSAAREMVLGRCSPMGCRNRPQTGSQLMQTVCLRNARPSCRPRRPDLRRDGVHA